MANPENMKIANSRPHRLKISNRYNEIATREILTSEIYVSRVGIKDFPKPPLSVSQGLAAQHSILRSRIC